MSDCNVSLRTEIGNARLDVRSVSYEPTHFIGEVTDGSITADARKAVREDHPGWVFL